MEESHREATSARHDAGTLSAQVHEFEQKLLSRKEKFNSVIIERDVLEQRASSLAERVGKFESEDYKR